MGVFCNYKLRVVSEEKGFEEVIKKLQNKRWAIEYGKFEIEKLEIGYEVDAEMNYMYFDSAIDSLFMLSKEYNLDCEIYVECSLMSVYEYYLIKKGSQISHVVNMYIKYKNEKELERGLKEEDYKYITREDLKENNGVYEYGNNFKGFVIGKRKGE